LNQFKKAACRGARDSTTRARLRWTLAATLIDRAGHAMSRFDRRRFLLARVAWLCAVTVLAVTTLSAFIRLSNAGLGCADWPQCYGQRGVEATAGLAGGDEGTAVALARLAHRLLAVLALLLIFLLIMVAYGEPPRLHAEGRIAIGLLALALLLAVLGRWSSGSRVPAISIANLIGGFAMLALSLRLAIGTGAAPPRRQRIAAGAAVLLLLAQVGVGGLVSASHAGASCVGWSDCAAAARDIPWATLVPWREPLLTEAPPFNAAGALPQSIHRGMALVLVLVLLPLAAVARRRGRPRTAAALIALLVAQLIAGLAMVHGSLPLGLALLHNLLAASLLATLLLLV
jgi:cytochrome c oxidase assembly protein subunit 15